MGVWVFVDDARDKPDSYDVKTESLVEFVHILIYFEVEKISFDHDLGRSVTGYDFARIATLFVIDGEISPFEWEVHSSNVVGADRIRHELNKIGDHIVE